MKKTFKKDLMVFRLALLSLFVFLHMAPAWAGVALVGAGEVEVAAPQEKTVTLNIQEATLSDVIKTIVKQCGSEILFFDSEESNHKCQNVQLRGVTVAKALETILQGSGLTFKMENGKYVIFNKGADQQKVDSKKEVVISGRVTDSNGDPLPHASIHIKGTNRGTYSGHDGYYSIKLPVGTTTLCFSFMSMETREMRIAATMDLTINVSLEDSENVLKEATLISTGYQKVDRRDLVGSLTTINTDEFLTQNYSSVDQMLQGIVPGMIVTNTSSRVGTAPSISIRGTSTLLGDTQPLWVVDGIIQEDPIKINATTFMSEDIKDIIGHQVSWLNPSDIESVTVLKDASATAIYGSKASNGVIVVTTKQARLGQERLSINYTNSLAVNTRPNYGQFNFMNSQERIQFSDEAFGSGVPYMNVPLLDQYSYEGLRRMYLEGYISQEEFLEKRAFLETGNTDWFKHLTRTGVSHTHNLSMMGSTVKTHYTSSISYSNQQGQEIGNNSDRFTGRISVGVKFSEKVRLNVSLTGAYNKNTAFGQGVGPMSYATRTSRAIPAYDELGDLAYYQRKSDYQYNKLIPSLGYNVLNERDNSGSFTESSRISATADFTWNIIPGLSYNFTGGYNYSGSNMQSHLSERTFEIANSFRGYDFGSVNPESDSFKAAILPFGGSLFTTHANQSSYNIQNKLAINRTFRQVDRLNILLGHELRSGTNISTANTVWGYSVERGETIIRPTLPEDLIPTPGAIGAYTGYGIFNELYRGRWRRLNQTDNFMSLFATFAYSIDNKYVINANIRNDFSNRFGQDVNKRLDPTYSFGASWRVAEEKFIRDHLSFITQFNIRATYGIQGNALTTESPELILNTGASKPVFNQYYSSISKIPNPHLTWERTTNWNLGADLQLFRKVSLIVDYYSRRSNAVISQEVPFEFGVRSAVMNGGIIYNSGLEGSITFSPVNKKDIGLSVSFNTSKNWNSTGAVVGQITLANYLNGRSGAIIKEGYPLSAFWSYSFAGLNPEDGTPIFNLLDTPEDVAKADPTTFLEYSGERDASITGGLRLNFRYKSFSLGTSFSMILGGKKRLPNPYADFAYGSYLPAPENNVTRTVADRWKQPGDELVTDIPSLSPLNSQHYTLPEGSTLFPIQMWAQSSALVVDASFLRCRNIDLSWRVNPKALAKAKITSLTVNASVNNLFVIASKKFNGFDPELTESVMPKAFSMGLSIGF